mmetsp:Transcript_11099/g.14022  ORF Transcript_11099/g.14022 Transcript_11099/m.14022 type:complete len:226 (+) Transcript_11099:1-678(+)
MSFKEIEAEVARLLSQLKSMLTVSQITQIVFSCILTVSVYALLFITWKRDTFEGLPRKIKITLLFYAGYSLYTLALITALWIEWDYLAIMAYDDKFWRVLLVIGFFAWASLQWQFTVYYLRTASLFRLTLRCRDELGLEQVEKRKSVLYVIEWTVQGLLLSFLIYMLAIAGKSRWNTTFCSFYICLIISLAVVTLLSARHIHTNSKSIEKLGIKTNSRAMSVYLI